jgi:hypothetical protein
VEGLETDGNTARFQTGDPPGTLASLASLLAAERVELVDLHLRKASLEEVFLTLTQTDGNEGNTQS